MMKILCIFLGERNKPFPEHSSSEVNWHWFINMVIRRWTSIQEPSHSVQNKIERYDFCWNMKKPWLNLLEIKHITSIDWKIFFLNIVISAFGYLPKVTTDDGKHNNNSIFRETNGRYLELYKTLPQLTSDLGM